MSNDHQNDVEANVPRTNPPHEKIDGGRTEVSIVFDSRSYRVLQGMRISAGIESDSAAIFAALRLMRELQRQAQSGFTEVLVQNPRTFDQIQIMLDLLKPAESTSDTVEPKSDSVATRGQLCVNG